MNVSVLQAEIDKLNAKTTLNATERRKLKKYESQLKELEKAGGSDDDIEEISVATPSKAASTPSSEPKASNEAKEVAEFKLAQAEAQFTGVAVDPTANPSFKKLLETFDTRIIDQEVEGSDFISVRFHRELKEFADGVATRISAFNRRKPISGVQVIELMMLEYMRKNKNRFEELNELYIKSISGDFKC